MKQYDAIIIGSGKISETLAIKLSGRGWRVAIINPIDKTEGEDRQDLTDSLHSLAYEAEIASLLYYDDYPKQAKIYKQAITRKDRLSFFLKETNSDKLKRSPNVAVFIGDASFTSSDTVKVTSGNDYIELKGKEIFIHAGSAPLIPPIEGIETVENAYINHEILDRNELPKHLIIVGDSYAGLEFASMYANFGSKVTILESKDRFMPFADRDVANYIKEVITRNGIEIHLDAHVRSLLDTEDGIELTYTSLSGDNPKILEGSAVLVTTGYRPLTDTLRLYVAGVKTNVQGNIIVNDQLRTNTPHIWALGTINEGFPLSPLLQDDVRIVCDQLFGERTRSANDRSPTPYTLAIDPPFAHIGINEEEALKKGHSIIVTRLQASTVTHSRILHQPDGILKAIINNQNGRIMGCTLFCANAPEMINIVAMAMKKEQHYSYLRDFVFSAPSMSQSLNDLFKI